MSSLLIVFILSIVALIVFVAVMILGFYKTNCVFWIGVVGMIISIFVALFSGFFFYKEVELHKYNRAVEQNYTIYLDGQKVEAEDIDIEFYWEEMTIDEERKVIKLASTD